MVGKLDLPADQLSGFKAAFTARVPTGRFGTAEEIANAVAFLSLVRLEGLRPRLGPVPSLLRQSPEGSGNVYH
jgi:NAD(P)-dependent dehydrogenase (short-subunit alcohol dehydrogenase family)